MIFQYSNSFNSGFQSFYNLDAAFTHRKMPGKKIDEGPVGLAVHGRGVEVGLKDTSLLLEQLFFRVGVDFDLDDHKILRQRHFQKIFLQPPPVAVKTGHDLPDLVPEPCRMVGDKQVAELVDDDVINNFHG